MRRLTTTSIILFLLLFQPACRYNTSDTNTVATPITPENIRASFTPASTIGDIEITAQAADEANKNSLVLNVKVNSTKNFFGVAFKLSYDPTIVQFVGFDVGDMPDATGMPLNGASLINGMEGKIAVGATLKRGAAMISGPGNIIRLRFKVVSIGSTALSFSENVVRDDSFNEVGGLIWSSGEITGR